MDASRLSYKNGTLTQSHEIGCCRLNGRSKEKYPRKQPSDKKNLNKIFVCTTKCRTTSNINILQLVDSYGQPYKESSVSSVSLPTASVVNGFRRAVMDANPDLLWSLDASQLKIFKNKTGFDGKEEALKDNCLVFGLGLSDKEALVVLVPTPQSRIARTSNLNQNESGVSGD
jgi:hypothetical protein